MFTEKYFRSIFFESLLIWKVYPLFRKNANDTEIIKPVAEDKR